MADVCGAELDYPEENVMDLPPTHDADPTPKQAPILESAQPGRAG